MLENMFTTKMSMDKKSLERRFFKIRFKGGKASSLTAVIASVILGITMVCSVAAMSALDGLNRYDIKIYSGDMRLNLDGKPFFYEHSVYVPLRETSERMGFLENGKNQILWDNNKITIYIDGDEDYYGIEIGSKQIKVDAVMPTINAMGTMEYRNAPIIVNDTTYVPLEFINFIYSRNSTAKDIYYVFGDIVSNEPYMGNIEYMEYDYIYQIQNEVDNGHYPWRLNAESTIQDYLSRLKGMENGRLTDIKQDMTKYSAIYKVDLSSYYIELFRPTGKDGIWVVKDFYNTNPPYTKKDINNAKEVVHRYLDAVARRDKTAVLSTLDSLSPDTKLWHDETITLNSLELDLIDSVKNGYSKWLEDWGTPVLPENIIVFTADLTIEVYGESPHTGGEYNGYSYVLVRNSKDEEWRIQGMGYFA